MSQPKLTFGGSNVQLDPNQHYEFFFGTSFPNELSARACIDKLSPLGLSNSLMKGGNNRWIASLTVVARADPKRIAELTDAIKAALPKHGGVLVVTGVSQPPAVQHLNVG